MKKYLIPGIPLCETITGIPRYMYEVLIRLDNMLEDNSTNFKLIVCYPNDLNFVEYKFKNIEIRAVDRNGKKWLPQVILPIAKKENATICDMADGFCLKKGGIVKIDDVRPITANFDPWNKKIQTWLLILMARFNAKVVVTVSESQRSLLRRLMPNKRIEIFPNGYSQLQRFTSDYKIFDRFPSIKKGEFYYTLGSVAKHKNFKWIYEVSKKNPDKQFVVAGNQDLAKWGTDSSEITSKNVIYVGYVSDDENKALYEHCKAFIHPSLYEGFGMPLLEAVSLGKDIAVSRIPEFVETYGDSITYFDPNKYEFDFNTIKHMSNEVRKTILDRFSWDDTAKQWYDLFTEL